MHDEVAHLRIVHRRLRLGLPRRVRGLIVRIDADNVQCVEIAEFGSAQLLEFAAEHQVQKLLLSVFRGHVGPLQIVNMRQV